MDVALALSFLYSASCRGASTVSLRESLFWDDAILDLEFYPIFTSFDDKPCSLLPCFREWINKQIKMKTSMISFAILL